MAVHGEQRLQQGELLLGNGAHLSAHEVRQGPFLRGGLWLNLACFSAGTPPESVYEEWLRMLLRLPVSEKDLALLLDCLPQAGASGFVSGLAESALANEQGPLGLIGHVDVMWSYSWISASGAAHPGRVLSLLRAWGARARAGLAVEMLRTAYQELNDDLATMYRERGRNARGDKPRSYSDEQLHHTWLSKNDLRGLIFLGDPAVTLPSLAGEVDRFFRQK